MSHTNAGLNVKNFSLSNTLAYSGRDKVTKPQRFIISVTAAGGAPSSFCVATALSRTDGRILTVFFF